MLFQAENLHGDRGDSSLQHFSSTASHQTASKGSELENPFEADCTNQDRQFEHPGDENVQDERTPEQLQLNLEEQTDQAQLDQLQREMAICPECGLLEMKGPRCFGLTPDEAVRELRFRIFCTTRLTSSAGTISNNSCWLEWNCNGRKYVAYPFLLSAQ
ncbi:unnamed protein product [Protopolystoma xenopodis]|uniref:Uncharacterized protein n=1 Tax=Protopolystoma xenopodis TaxID=117903 RepID=A0A3S5A099_9PLAT|nr:unnamed protein product [Protopolystoma xenopodis]